MTVLASRSTPPARLGGFTLHFFEMCAPMCVGFAIGDLALLEHGLMMPAMLVPMVLPLDVYTSRHSRHGRPPSPLRNARGH